MADQDILQKDTYFVAVKLFLEKDGKLFIFKDKFGAWDLPGGRIKKHEFETPLKEIIARKMSEEVGFEFQYKIEDRPVVLMRHERVEASPGNPVVRIFGIGIALAMVWYLNRGTKADDWWCNYLPEARSSACHEFYLEFQTIADKMDEDGQSCTPDYMGGCN